MNKKVLILLLLTCLTGATFARQSLSTVSQSTGLAGNNSTQLIGTVVSITEDPIEGQWVNLRVGCFDILVWYRNGVEMASIGAEIRVLAIYIDNFKYPSGDVSIYKGLSWEAVE